MIGLSSYFADSLGARQSQLCALVTMLGLAVLLAGCFCGKQRDHVGMSVDQLSAELGREVKLRHYALEHPPEADEAYFQVTEVARWDNGQGVVYYFNRYWTVLRVECD